MLNLLKFKNENENEITQFGKYISPETAGGEFIGIARVNLKTFRRYLDKCEELLMKKQYSHYYEDVSAQLLIEEEIKINSLSTDKLFWTEIDTAEDLRNIWDLIDILS